MGIKASFWTVAAVVISLVSLGWTAYTNYKLFFAAFRVTLGIGSPAFTVCNRKEDGTYSLCPIVPIEFINVGAKPGLVRDVMLFVSVEARPLKSLLQPVAFCTSFGQGALDEVGREPFRPFALNTGERLVKNILFYPGEDAGESNPLQIKGRDSLPDGLYRFEFYLNTEAENRLSLVCDRTYYVPKEVVDSLAADGPMYIPTDKSTVDARMALKKAISRYSKTGN
ncbi:MAG: hypothetical protein ACP5SH_07095 [Syntrophobacteraceae bacterium]